MGAFYPLVWSFNVVGAVLVLFVLWHTQLYETPEKSIA
jgi:formate/nitrite transporter FocA (FNT family)